VGRLIQVVQEGRQGDNTLILYIVGDNGDEASLGLDGTDNVQAELKREHRSVESQLRDMDELGGPLHFNVYASAWAWAGSTPFQWVKNVASHFGGTRNPLIVSWPARIKAHGGLRSQFTHVNDVAATLYDAAGIQFPDVVDGVKQLPLDGFSFADTFTDPDAPSKHRVQYFEMEGNRAIYRDGWLAAARHGVPWLRVRDGEFLASGKRASKSDLMHDRWELYHVAEDFSEAHDVARKYPEKLKALQALFDEEARRNDVYPLDVGIGSGSGHPLLTASDRREYVYFPGFPGGGRGPNFAARHRITADVFIPNGTTAGVIMASGGRFG
jgi:arylsulfatase